jgi:hypothetical protein
MAPGQGRGAERGERSLRRARARNRTGEGWSNASPSAAMRAACCPNPDPLAVEAVRSPLSTGPQRRDGRAAVLASEKRLFTAASPAAHRADGCLADGRPHGVCSGCQRVRWRCSVLDLSRDPLRTADCQAFAQTGRGSIQVRSVLWGHRRWATSGSPYMRASTGPDASTGVRT